MVDYMLNKDFAVLVEILLLEFEKVAAHSLAVEVGLVVALLVAQMVADIHPVVDQATNQVAAVELVQWVFRSLVVAQ